MSPEDKYDEAKGLVSSLDENFIELGHALIELNETDTAEFQRLIKNTGLGSRKAYYLIDIARTFSKIPTPKKRLKKIGWTKLMMLSKHVTKANYAEMLRLAEENTAANLRRILNGKPPLAGDAHCMVLYVNPDDFETLAEAMALFGAETRGRGIYDKEAALVAMAEDVLNRYQNKETA